MSEIFVFGSNMGGYHGAGAARYALRNKGAILYQAAGLQGQSYAIPTKDKNIKHTLPLTEIQAYVDTFKEFARQHHNLTFQVTRIGCGLAGLRDDMIAPMFKGAPFNCRFDTEWERYLGDRYDYWGTF